MKIKSLLLTALAVSALAVGSASASVIVSYGGNSLSLFSDSGTKILDYSTSLVNPQQVVTDNSGHVYVAEYGTPGAFDGNIKMYDIASGTFIRNVISGSYGFTGLAFNPANSGEIIVMGQYSGTQSQLGRWLTSTTGSNVNANSALGVPYAGIYYNPTISGGAPEGIYVAATAGVVQRFDSASLAFVDGSSISAPNPQGITGIGADLFFSSGTGVVTKYSGGISTTILSNPDTYYGITTDGSDIWLAQYSTGYAARYNTSGALQSYFAVSLPVGLAYTPVPEPSTVVAALGLAGLMLWGPLRRRLARRA